MSIHDRPYARSQQPTQIWSNARLWSVNTVLIVVNVAIFALGMIVPALGKWIFQFGHFSTKTLLPPQWEFWRLISFQFLHASVMHVAMNMLGLYVFGRIVEEHLGRTRYLAFYIVCGICGGLMYFLLNALGQLIQIPGALFIDTATPLVGASAGVFGVMLACAFLEPNTQMVAFPIPIPMKMRTMVYAYLAISVFMLFYGRNNAGGEAAHVGGAIGGYFFIRNLHLLRDFFDVFKNSQKARGSSRNFDPVRTDREVDRILDKVQAQGLQSLTAKEREILRAGTETRRNAG